MSERIYLRALLVEFPDSDRETFQAIALPDGRFIIGGNITYSSERTLLKHNPDARIYWTPDADATINHVEDEGL